MVKESSIEQIYDRASKNLANSCFYCAKKDIRLARDLAKESGINNKLYERELVKVAYDAVGKNLPNLYINGMKDGISLARDLAEKSGVEIEPYEIKQGIIALQYSHGHAIKLAQYLANSSGLDLGPLSAYLFVYAAKNKICLNGDLAKELGIDPMVYEIKQAIIAYESGDNMGVQLAKVLAETNGLKLEDLVGYREKGGGALTLVEDLSEGGLSIVNEEGGLSLCKEEAPEPAPEEKESLAQRVQNWFS